ncbi:hypothetical protein SFC43_28480 [Bacteroides sp. CR5/BHMF/2]|nr:hypothetical protein [Bacteroides sp. CR5/BHMF/2]
MNIHQTLPRTDCTHFAKCGERSIAYCRRYGAHECLSCRLVKRKPKNRVIVDGVERKRCTHCGKVLPFIASMIARCSGTAKLSSENVMVSAVYVRCSMRKEQKNF